MPAVAGHIRCGAQCGAGLVPTWAVLGSASNGTNDVDCTLCSDLVPKNTFWESAAGLCTKCRTCNASQYSDANCTSAIDTSCQPCPACVPGASYYSRNCSSYVPSVCTTCDAPCRLGQEYEQTACTLHTNRKCQPCSTSCPAEQYISSSCAATEDIKCSACRNCSAGEYISVQCQQTVLGSKRECVACQPGTYSAAANKDVCTQCPAGTYSPEARATTCLACRAGTYISDAGASACLACGEGKYSIVAGVSSCLTCPPATYLSNATLGTCVLCPAGSYNSQDGMTYCRACQPGAFAPAPTAARNNSNCTPCPVGYAAGASSASNCSACAPGTYAGIAGLSTCMQCPAGTYANFSGASACVACGPGNFSAGSGALQCEQCPVGTRSNLTTGSTSCTGCAAGTFASGAGWARCQTCAPECVLGQKYTEVNCTAATNRVCSPCRRNRLCPLGQTSNVTWCPASGWFDCMPCPSYGNDHVHLHPEYSCQTCTNRSCGLTPGTYQAAACRSTGGNYTVDDTYACGRCLGCNYRQYVVDWGFCDGKGAEDIPLDPTTEQHCMPCTTNCRPGQYVANLCTGRTTRSTETCANCTSCPLGFYHAKKLPGKTYPPYEGEPWTDAEPEAPCDGKGIRNSDGVTDCERCDACAPGQYASDVRRCTGNGIWKDNFTCTDCKPCASGYEHVVPCNGLSFNDSCKLCPACAAGHHAVSTWNSTAKRMVCGCRRCLDAPGDVCPVHFFKTNRTCSGRMPHDEACEECSLCNAGEYIAGGAFCTGATFADTSAGKCRWVERIYLSTKLLCCTERRCIVQRFSGCPLLGPGWHPYNTACFWPFGGRRQPGNPILFQ